jgi:short subunit dehydrogenase-like uncharacterized protein
MASSKTLDLALFGASGFTGGLVADYLARRVRARPLRWALAGRNRQKLESLKDVLAAAHPHEGLAGPEIVFADSADDASLRALAARAKVVITTVGPYAKYGEPLVRACAEVGADYVDLTGEPGFADAMIERYQARAVQSGAKIVHACGFDSIPHDLGAYFTLKQLRARMSAEQRERLAVKIEAFVRVSAEFSGGTWHSAVNGMANMRADEKARRRRPRQPDSDGRKVRGLRGGPGFRKELGMWALPMPTIDPQIVLRSARSLPEYGPDFSYGHYLALRHAHQVLGLTLGVAGAFTLAQFAPTRALLLKLRDPGQGPNAETRERSWFQVIFLGQAGEHRVRCEVRGGDPGYGETAKMLAESALCLALDGERLPARAGFLTSVEARGEPLLERIQAAGISFALTD